MKIEPRTLKGFRDFLPKEARKRQYVIETLRKVFESYGFEPLETPALEYEDILLGKYGEEGDKLMYRFEDNGQRRVVLRYDQTVPLARVVAQYQNDLPMPFKRYQIQNVWRAENTQKGRFREFLQCDIDTVGSDSVISDVEIVKVAIDSLEKLGFQNFKVLVNDRKNLFTFKDGEELPLEQGLRIIRAVDKLKKIGRDAVIEEIIQTGTSKELAEEILGVIGGKLPTERIAKLIESLNNNKVTFDPLLARGLDYYTGLIIEVEIEGFDAGSVGGGGRYDGLIGIFSNQDMPAVGFAFGFDRLIEAMEEKGLFPTNLTTTQVLVTVVFSKLENTSYKISEMLRGNNINAETYPNNQAQLEKQFKYAEKKEIPFVVIPLSETEVELRTKNQAGEIVKKTVRVSDLPNALI